MKPSPSVKCPGQPCLTLTQYFSTYHFMSSGSVFVFLTGNHSLESRVFLHDASNVTFMKESGGGVVYINCRNRADFYADNMAYLSIIGLRFVCNSSIAFLRVSNTRNLLIEASHFYSTALDLLINTTLTMKGCVFQEVAGSVIEVALISSTTSTINLTHSIFIDNKVRALNAFDSNITLIENSFSNNRAGAEGECF